MLFITTYRTKPFLSREETREMMEVFGEAGTGPGTIAHYVFADGGGGVVISESSPADDYRNTLNYTPWVQFETTPVLSIDDALPHLMDVLS